MKANERHQLKQNEFAHTTAQVVDTLTENRGRVALFIGLAILAVAVVSGFLYWRSSSRNEAGAALAIAVATAQSPVVPAPTLPGATQQPGTFATEPARAEAAIKAFNEVATKYAGTDAGVSAAYQAAGEELARGRAAEAEKGFAAVAASGNSFYVPLAKLGQAEAMLAAGKTSEALAIYTELSAARDGALPVDGILMELGRASLKAGKPADAKAAFQRVVNEFPESSYVADARARLAAIN